MVSGRLQGRDVAVVAGPYADPDVYGAVQGDLSEAGANITGFEPLPAPESDEITLLENTSPQAMTRLEEVYAETAREVVGFTGEVENPAEIVIFVGGGKFPEEAPPGTADALRAAQAEMFEVWLAAGVRVVAAEPTNAGRSEVQLFQDVGIPSAVNADRPAGRAALIECAAMEDCEGTYGTKDRATDAFPSPS
jgi:hypothetical protein